MTALWVSIFIHISFLVWSYFAKLMPPTPFPERAEAVFHVKIDREEHFGDQKFKFDTNFSHKSPKPDNPFTENPVNKTAIESDEQVRNNIESSIEQNKQALIPSPVQMTQAVNQSQLTDMVIARNVRHAVRQSLTTPGQTPTENFASGAPVLTSGEDISQHFLDRGAVAASEAMASPHQAANTDNEFQMMKKSAAGVEHASQAMDLGTALTYQLTKYIAPSGQKYFRLSVKVRDATVNFPVIPKEIIFLVDASGSIGMGRLHQFEDGLIYSVKHLNPDDRFNIFVFKDKSMPLSPSSLSPTTANINKAINFLADQKTWSTTDIFDALRTSINLQNPFVPSYRVFMSDGFPTTGIIDARHVINQISQLNDNKVSIFTFGGGSDVDPYMLDFIAFKNRGWSSVVDREHFMGREFGKLYDEIKDPLLLNVRYYVSGVDDQQIFPQTMPDFFKGSEFVIYGKYTTEDKFAIQIRGDMVHDKKEFIVTASLKNAPLGTKQIAHDWAFHKVYYLISLLKYDEDNGPLLDQIHELCVRFHIITPYSISFHNNAPVVVHKQVAMKQAVLKPAVKK